MQTINTEIVENALAYEDERKQELFEMRKDLVNRKNELQRLIGHTGINTHSRSSAIYTASEERLKKRERYVKEIMQVDRDLAKIKREVHIIESKKDSDKYIFIGILKEIFTESQVEQIFTEQQNRRDGGQPNKLNLSAHEVQTTQDKMRSLKKILKDLIDEMLEARESLSNIIEIGMTKYGKEEFLNLTLPLNKLIPKSDHLKRLKRESNL